jgi:polar amino acid transport system substrate-binding protein
MSTKRNSRFSPAFWLTAAAAVLTHGGAVQARDLTFCIDEASPAAAVDEKLGQAIGKQENVPVQFYHYMGVPKGDDDDFDLHRYKGMLAGACDIVLGFPSDGKSELPKFLRATQPYASTGFVLVTAKRSRYNSLDRMPRGTHVAVAYNTYANYFFRHHANVVADIVEDDAAALQAIASKQVTGALLWRPAVALQSEKQHADVDMHALSETDSSWNLVALYSAPGEKAAHDFEAAVAVLRTNGELARALGRYEDATPLTEARRTAIQSSEPAAQTTMRTRAAPKATCAAAPALYTQAQADAGKPLFLGKCAICHGPTLEGRAGPALKGKMFLPASAGHTVGDIFTIVSQNMPATLPGSLDHGDYVKIMSFLLQQNGYPSGAAELTFDGALKSKTPMVYQGP